MTKTQSHVSSWRKLFFLKCLMGVACYETVPKQFLVNE